MFVYLSRPKAWPKNGWYQMNYHNHALCLRYINFAQSKCARHIRLPMGTVEQGHRTETLLNWKYLHVIRKKGIISWIQSNEEFNQMRKKLKIISMSKTHDGHIPGKTSIWDRSQVELINMLIMQQISSISNHSRGQTIRQVVMNCLFGELVYHQSHPSSGKWINLMHTKRKPIAVVQCDHLDCNCCIHVWIN